MKNVAPSSSPHFGPASLDFHLNRPVISLIQLQNTPVISLIQLHIVPPALPAGIVAPVGPSWLVPEPPLIIIIKYIYIAQVRRKKRRKCTWVHSFTVAYCVIRRIVQVDLLQVSK